MNTIRIITCSILISKYDTCCLSCGDYRKVLKITSTKIYQGQIQTTFTYANAKVTFSVVKFLKNTRIPIFSTKLLSSFLLPIEKIRKSQAKDLPWLFCRSCRTSLHFRHAVKTVCSRNIRKLSNNQKLKLITEA